MSSPPQSKLPMSVWLSASGGCVVCGAAVSVSRSGPAVVSVSALCAAPVSMYPALLPIASIAKQKNANASTSATMTGGYSLNLFLRLIISD